MERRRLTALDVAIPGPALVLGMVELASLRTTGWLPSIGLEIVAASLLVWRRILPAAVAPLASVVLMLIPLTGARMDDVATPILFIVLAIYSLGRYLPLRGAALAAGLTILTIGAQVLTDPGPNDPTDAVFVLSLTIPPWVFGRVTRRLSQQAQLLAEQREVIREQAVREERTRIARDLHDVVAHSVSAMVVQTAVAQDLVERDPTAARQALEEVAQTGRAALAETGQVLNLLRDDDDELGLAPAPGLWLVPDLLDRVRTAGLEVAFDASVPSAPLPGAADVSAYRVIQEALTNALRHGAERAHLTVATRDDAIEIECTNPIDDTASQHTGSGLGLRGMAERVALLGGSLNHGRVGDTFRVHAVLPCGSP